MASCNKDVPQPINIQQITPKEIQMVKTVRVPLPNRGDGYRVIRGRDGRMTTVPLTNSDVTNYRSLLAMDAAPVGGPKGSPNYASYNAKDDVDDINEPDSEGYDLADKIRQLLEGKLDDADIDMLIKLIQPDDDAPAPAQDRKRGRQAHDRRPAMPSRAEILRRVSASGEVRAQRVLEQNAKLMERFPALKNARVA
jgi:hypothetical protein